MLKRKRKLTIELIEQKSGVKLVYPHQKIPGNMDEERYKELIKFGCSDIWDDENCWLHRDCFHQDCKNCAYYSIKEKYDKENNLSDYTTDFLKAVTLY